jgi:phenylalanyl-tRNA synthetase beta chain
VATGGTAAELPVPCTETLTLAGAITGRAFTSAWNLSDGTLAADLSEVKGLLDLLASELRLPAPEAGPCDEPIFEPGRAGQWSVDGRRVAIFGEVAAEVRAAYDIRGEVVVFEVDLDWMLSAADTRRTHRPLPRYPAALRDLALIVPDAVPQAAVADAIRDDAEHLDELRLFDVYRGQGLAADERSLAYSLSFRHADRTLTDAEVDAAMARIVARVEAACGAKLRS